ncbi:P-loop containing nucleoside triphosphate hydrolase protein [Mycena haematopus]|nr:P-loop containing nucleoside triphosphate hydrolase protein [Mycena haematopus]
MSISQDLLPLCLAPRDISVNRVSVAKVSPALIEPLKALRHVGISTQLSRNGRLKRLALSTSDAVLLVSVDCHPQSSRHTALAELLLGGPIFVGFGIASIALQIHRDIGTHFGDGVDLSTLFSLSTREPWMADACAQEIDGSLKVNTKNLAHKELALLGDFRLQVDALVGLNPKENPKDFIRGVLTADGMELENARYQKRVRSSHQTSVIMTNAAGQEFTGRADGVKGRITDIKFDKGPLTGELAAVRVVGKEELTNSEKARDEFILLALRGEINVTDARFIRLLWFLEPEQRKELAVPETFPAITTPALTLNASQMRTLAKMISTMPIVIVQGPPGTGKTQTISAAAAVWEDSRSPTWIIAQSNVAVKNIAEKLAKLGIMFKIVVSKEFYVGWHEHIYGSIDGFLIRTDELMADKRGIVHMLSGAQIILSTLSTLSNPGLEQVGIFALVPVERLVVDEASQINAFEFMVWIECPGPLSVDSFVHSWYCSSSASRSKKSASLAIRCNVLPPYGQEQVPTLKSVFDFKHLRHVTEFLEIQYRMPAPIAKFISASMYDRKLHSQHPINSMNCLAFIDVVKGTETSRALSWTVIPA